MRAKLDIYVFLYFVARLQSSVTCKDVTTNLLKQTHIFKTRQSQRVSIDQSMFHISMI
jgi:hypothetical protein